MRSVDARNGLLKMKSSMKISYLLIFVILLSMAIPVSSAIKGRRHRNNVRMKVGVNYLSTHWHYEEHYLSNQELIRDFRLFREQGLETITLVAVWKYLEPEPGIYNIEALDDILRICNIAKRFNIKVIIDFHTMMHENTFTMPEWLSPRKFETVFTDSTARKAWLDFLDFSVSFLSKCKNIYSWHMMNEPARREWACDVSVDDFLLLWREMRDVFKTHSDRPVSIRFGGETFDTHFNRDPRIYEILDYVSFNWYEEHCSRELLEDMVKEARDYLQVVISEFGFESDDDVVQRDAYSDYITFFDNLGVKRCIAWMWRADYDLGSPDVPGTGYNLAENVMGVPRPAFYELQR